MKSPRETYAKMFRTQFGKLNDGYLQAYISLRESGDDHWTAVETIRNEIQTAKMTKGATK